MLTKGLTLCEQGTEVFDLCLRGIWKTEVRAASVFLRAQKEPSLLCINSSFVSDVSDYFHFYIRGIYIFRPSKHTPMLKRSETSETSEIDQGTGL